MTLMISKKKEEDFFKPFFHFIIEDFEKQLNYYMNRTLLIHINQSSIVRSIMDSFENKLNVLASKTLINEFHESFDEFDEENDKAHYDAFLTRLEDAVYRDSIFAKYPVLLHMIQTLSQQLIEYTVNIINQYEADYDSIKSKFNRNFGQLKKINIDLGDTHCKGKSVAIIHLEKGTLIYKPRSLKADLLYAQIVSTYNTSCNENLKNPISLDRGHYGWQEFTEFLPCKKLDEVSQYYYELGMHLAFIYIFNGSDFHYENIIAHGSQPILIDLETMFQGELDFLNGGNQNIDMQVSNFIGKTVYHSTFFMNASTPEENSRLQVGGISKIEDQEIVSEEIINKGTDKVSIKKVKVKLERAKNLPVYKDKPIEIYNYEHDFINGFVKVYQWARESENDLLQLIHAGDNFPVRVIVRPTYVYVQYLKTLTNPKYLQDASERIRVLSFLKDSYERYEAFHSITSYEINDMYEGDVPYFYTYFDSTSVFSSKDEEMACNLITRSPKKEIIKKISRLSKEDMLFQIQLINLAVSAANSNREHDAHSKGSELPTGKPVETNHLIENETTKLLNQQIPIEGYAQWISVNLSPDGKMVAGPVGYGIYDGLAGIGIYLSAYYKLFGHQEESTRSIAQNIARTMDRILENSRLKEDLSVFSGTSSFIYYMEYLRKQNVIEEDVMQRYVQFAEQVIEQANKYDKLDFIGGLAGTLKLLTNLYSGTGLTIVQEAAKVVCEVILSRAIQNNDEIYWYSDHFEERILTGFSHGITGICFSLSEYCKVFGSNQDIINVIQKALNKEDQYYISEQKGWLDNRNTNGNCSNPYWCHGASGILLGRARIKENLGNVIHINYLDIALDQTIKDGYVHQQGNSLCHGTIGNVDILLEVSKLTIFANRRAEIETTINNWVNQYYEQMSKTGWQNGMANDSSSIGFMMGKTGQLYTLLRLQDASLPSVLVLD
ncbi:type 2 lanthipeptide synthetase LanM [Paenibacillus sp. L3-i20]|uniref:type 2 lanthipeptide synthetase LanM n=1 Tax=Paenibacillus sp. L3-i20 TaxID=2905833 RepID=UPI001EE042F2|nr:type 2 lanthipeptide synthetase LanM [Paenibacillus sp. L3-i20]